MEAAEPAAEPVEAPSERIRVLVPSPIGPLALELAGLAVVRLVVAPKPGAADGFAPLGKGAAPEVVEEVVGPLAEYFAGARKRVELDFEPALADLDTFAQRTLREACRVPYGKTRTYRDLAGVLGRADDAELVRGVLLANPVPILVPCHRLILGSGKIGAWVGGSERKKWLLALERDGTEAL
jgi:methylated-DNA-[protein]-cysteine S-methyltransferase